MKRYGAALVCAWLVCGQAGAELFTHLQFDNNLDDSAVGGNDATFYGGAAATFVDGYDRTANGAIEFDGVDDYIMIAHNDRLPLYGNPSFSMAFWVKGSLPIPDDMRVFSMSSSASNTPLYTLGTDSADTNRTGAIDFYLRDDANVQVMNHINSVGIALDGTWHHVAWVDDGGTVTLYIDGVADGASFSYARTAVTLDTTTFGAVYRGARVPPESHWYACAIDDVRFYDHALIEDEVQDLQPACPGAGDTHCGVLNVVGPADGAPGTYTASVSGATDTSGDTIIYTFVADNGAGQSLTVGPQVDINFADFNLGPGTWTVTATVDDDEVCPDAAADVTCTEQVTVTCPGSGDTHATGLTITGGPADSSPGIYTLTATATDDSGNQILYTFVADNGVDEPIVLGPRSAPAIANPHIAQMALWAGAWTVTVQVDDTAACSDAAPDAQRSAQVTVTELPQQLISRWKLDGDLTDAQPSANNGTFVGDAAPTFVEGYDGTANGAISLDGVDDYVEISQNKGLPISAHKAYSVCLWVKGLPTGGTGTGDRRVFSEGYRIPTERNPLCNIGTHNAATNGAVDIFIRNDRGQTYVDHRHSMREAFTDTWHHIAWVDNDGNAILYIDGIRDATGMSYVRSGLTGTTTTLGAILRDVPAAWYAGAIDEVRVYNYALSEADVLALVPEPPGCPAAGDTHCGGIVIEPPAGAGIGTYTARATGVIDDSGDATLYYTFVAQSAAGEYLQAGPDVSDAQPFFLIPGTWTISVTVDDDLGCRDRAVDASRSQEVTVVGPDPILVSHWKFDGNLDDSGDAGNEGQFVGGDPVFVAGHDGTAETALSFDGIDDHVAITYNDGLPIYSQPLFTVALWVKGPTGQVDRRVFSEGSSTSDTQLFNMGTDNTGGTGTADVYIRSDANVATVAHRHSTASAFDGTWHHIAYVDRYGEAKMYIDGVADATDFRYARPVLTADTTSIGAIVRMQGPSHWFTGAIDDVRLYNYVLSDAEIRALVEGAPPEVFVYTGDANGDGAVNIADAIYVLSYLFARGPAPKCMKAGDSNDDNAINIADAIKELGFLFGGGPMIAPSGTEIRPPAKCAGYDASDIPATIGTPPLPGCATQCTAP